MKIAYIYVLFNNTSIGVLEKIKDQEQALIELNDCNTDIIVYNPEKSLKSDRVIYVKYAFSSMPLIQNLLLLFAKYFILRKTFDLKGYDKIILRYPGADFTGASFMKKYPGTILEFHSLLIDEFKSKIRDTGSLPLKSIRTFRLLQEKIFSKSIIKRCAGIISMSNQISEGLINRYKLTIPAITVSNGINASKINQTGFAPFNGEELKIVFIGSRPESWHGLDRLVLSTIEYKKKYPEKKIEIHFIGNITEADIEIDKKYDQLFFHGIKYGPELDELMSKMHIAVCQLALYKKRLMELSTLKSCEYIARGIPFLLGYNDPNLYNVGNDNKFFVQFPNDNSLIDFTVIFNFMKKMEDKKKEILNYMKNYTNQNLDWVIKIREYIEFAKLEF